MPTAGEKALDDGPVCFNKEASKAFRKMTEDEREELQAKLPNPTPMTKGEINRKGSRIFQKIQKSVC